MKVLLGIATFLVSFVVWADGPFELSGSIQDEAGKALQGAVLNINGQTAQSMANGTFKLRPEAAGIYKISIKKTGYYETYQVFSHSELTQGHEKKHGKIGDVQLVSRKDGRTLFTFAGDAMMGRRYWAPYFGDPVLIDNEDTLGDAQAIVAEVKPYLELADFSVVNLETQITTEKPTEKAPKSVVFYSPPEMLEAFTGAGVDYVTLGNNHTFDYLDSGLQATLKHLDQSGLGYSGAGINEVEALKPYAHKGSANTYDMLGYVGWEGGFSPNQIAGRNKGGAAMGSSENIVASVMQSANKQHHPIVQYHGSLEYGDEPSGVTEQRLKQAIDNGAVMAIAHHPHVTQGIELYRGKLIAYSMGNFIFDQYFYSTAYSYLLNVWMDGDSFHRAEIIPIYLKGYMPTPATGSARYTLMKRVKTLSSLRGTRIFQSGGHGVISADEHRPSKKKDDYRFMAEHQRTLPLFSLPWQQSVTGVKVPENVPYRLGKVLSNGGDFEAHTLFASDERGWMFEGVKNQIIKKGNTASMQLVKGKEHARIGMKNFTRVYQASNPATVTLDIETEKEALVRVFWQGRKTRQKFKDALANSPLHLVDEFELKANQLTTINADFNSPRIGHRSYRILVEVESEEQTFTIDNFHLIEWQSAYTSEPMPVRITPKVQQASYLGFEVPVSGEIIVTIQ